MLWIRKGAVMNTQVAHTCYIVSPAGSAQPVVDTKHLYFQALSGFINSRRSSLITTTILYSKLLFLVIHLHRIRG